MATNFPSSIDNFTNPTSSDTLDSPDHAAQHTDVNDAVEAIETALLDGAPLHIDDANERVGIGTTTPSETLDVRSANNNTSVFQHTTNGSDARIELRAPDAGGTSRAGQVFFDSDANFVGFRNGNINAMGVDSSGNVGIGTTSPQTRLGVSGDIDVVGNDRSIVFGRQSETGPFGFEVWNGGSLESSFVYRTTPDAWSFENSSGTDILTVDIPNQRVGIGTATPSYKLDVSGTFHVTGQTTADGDIYFQNNALVASNAGTSNIDHIWHDETNNAWNFVSDTTYKAAGNSALNAGTLNVTTANATTVNLSTSVHLTNVDADGSMRVQGNNGYIDIGPKNATYCHIYTDRGSFYFNKTTLYANSTSNVIYHAGNVNKDGVDWTCEVLRCNEASADNGSATDPSFTFASDTDTGMYRYSTNNFALSGGGTVKLHSDGSGVVANGRMYCNTQLAVAAQTSTAAASIWCDRNVNATGSYSNYHYGRTNAVFRNTNSARAAVNGFWTTYSTDRGVTYGIWNGEANRFRVTTMTNNGYAYVNAAGFTVVSAAFTKERIRTARDENGDGLIDVSPADQNRAFQLFQQLRPVIYDDVEKSVEGVWLGCDVHETREECFAVDCEGGNNTTLQEHDCDMDPDCGGTNDNPCPIYMEHYNKLHFIADEVDEVYPHAVSNRADGSVVGIDHHVLATEHINVTQHLIDAVAELQSRVNELEGAA